MELESEAVSDSALANEDVERSALALSEMSLEPAGFVPFNTLSDCVLACVVDKLDARSRLRLRLVDRRCNRVVKDVKLPMQCVCVRVLPTHYSITVLEDGTSAVRALLVRPSSGGEYLQGQDLERLVEQIGDTTRVRVHASLVFIYCERMRGQDMSEVFAALFSIKGDGIVVSGKNVLPNASVDTWLEMARDKKSVEISLDDGGFTGAELCRVEQALIGHRISEFVVSSATWEMATEFLDARFNIKIVDITRDDDSKEREFRAPSDAHSVYSTMPPTRLEGNNYHVFSGGVESRILYFKNDVRICFSICSSTRDPTEGLYEVTLNHSYDLLTD